MKKVLILFMAISLFAACKDDKGGKKADYRDKDDYSNTDEKTDDANQADDKSKKDENQTDFTGGNGWPQADKNSFFNTCLPEFGTNQELGKKICSCMLEKYELKYASFAEADRAPESVGKAIGQECLQAMNINPTNNNPTNNDNSDYSSGGWSSNEVQEFISTCVPAARKSGLSDLDAQSYCDCVQYKLAKIYPNYAEANKLTNADFQKPNIQSLIQSCRPGN